MATHAPVTLDTPIVIKILFRGQTKKFKLPLKDLGANVLPDKLRAFLQISPEQDVVFERYSDSAGAYVTLDADKPQVYKTLFRAAKAKLKLRLKATIPGEQPQTDARSVAFAPEAQPSPLPSLHRLSADTLIPQKVAPMAPVIAHSPQPAPFPCMNKPMCPVTPFMTSPLDGEAPVPRSFTARQNFFNNIAKASYNADLAFRPKPNASVCPSWVVYCNACNQPMEDEHFHCGVCDGGDYDLCPSCVEAGAHCLGTGHWMVKRFVKNGRVVNSTTQRVPPKSKAASMEDDSDFVAEQKKTIDYDDEPTRTCNCCVDVLPEKDFVTCTVCADYDLCLGCHMDNKHGHHPGHAFKAAHPDTDLPAMANILCKSGRNIRHSAVCDGCDKHICGVRHKCLNCPDWDYCSDCMKSAKFIHPRHRFVPIYEPLAEPLNSSNRHYGIYCDGPLCKASENLRYIEGVRYKCAVCHDTDFCQNCEAHPSNKHNHTHPLIKFKTPVRSVSVTTVNDDKMGRPLATLGDRQPLRRSTATETVSTAFSTNAATQVQTILDQKPTDEPQVKKEKIAIRDLLIDSVEPAREKSVASMPEIGSAVPLSSLITPVEKTVEDFDAHFIRDTILDGSEINANSTFVQVWTMRNPGPHAWPAGCSVRHVGGDNMLNLDNTRPLSHAELAEASESNVIGRVVEAGEEISFRVILKAPAREGTAISYWRLKTADGLPFGHRLWCDITVVSPPLPSPTMQSANAAESEPVSRSPVQQEAVSKQHMELMQRVREAAVEQLLSRRQIYRCPGVPSYEEVKRMKEEQKRKEEQAAELPLEEKKEQAKPSGMIFPQLDKESPESSTYASETTAQVTSPMSEKSAFAPTLTVASDEEFFEDAESVALDSDDDGFMTEEEYDILDASDEEAS